jgi:hypothetical protein
LANISDALVFETEKEIDLEPAVSPNVQARQ